MYLRHQKDHHASLRRFLFVLLLVLPMSTTIGGPIQEMTVRAMRCAFSVSHRFFERASCSGSHRTTIPLRPVEEVSAHRCRFLRPRNVFPETRLCAAASHPSPTDREGGTQILDLLGPPSELLHLGVGDKPLRAYRRYASREANNEPATRTFTIERASTVPHVFVLRGFASKNECEALMDEAAHIGMAPAETASEHATGVFGTARVKSRVAWLNNDDSNGIVGSLARAVAGVLLPSEILRAKGAGCEDLQLLHYEEGGEYKLHHDGAGRVLTVIYFLNGVGGTWFPLATVQPTEQQRGEESARPRGRAEALDRSKRCIPGEDGVLIVGDADDWHQSTGNTVRVQAGDAIAFYNHYTAESSTAGRKEILMDWNTLHAGLPVQGKAEGGKWIANHWFHAGEALHS